MLITVDDACYVPALLLLLGLVPCITNISITIVGTSIVALACCGASIVAHAFARFLCSALSATVLTEFLGFLCSALPTVVSQGFCALLPTAVFTGCLYSALSITVLTGFLCSTFMCSSMCPIF
ncbi:unnamed protein product [Prunus brigantina]